MEKLRQFDFRSGFRSGPR